MKKTQSAFTFLEAMIVIALLAVCALMTVPGLQSLLARQQDEALAAGIERMILRAASEAQLLHKTITLCKSETLEQCGGDWSRGQLLFVDEAGDGVIRETSQILMAHDMKAGRGQLHVRFYPRYRDTIQFHFLVARNTDNGTFWYCREHAEQPAFAIVVDKMGKYRRLSKSSDGVIRDANHAILKC